MFGSLLKAVATVVETPVALVADVVTMGGVLTDRDKPYTAEAMEKLVDNVQNLTKKEGN